MDIHKDYYAWITHQVTLLNAKKWHQLDIENLTDELNSLARAEKQNIEYQISLLLANILTWDHHIPGQNQRTLVNIRCCRFLIDYLIKDSPSLESYSKDIKTIREAYVYALFRAAENNPNVVPSIFPKKCYYTSKDLYEREFIFE